MIKIKTKIKNGKFSENISYIHDAINIFESQDVTLTIEKTVRKRTNNQNAFYWAVVIPSITRAVIETGNEWTDSDSHLMARNLFLKKSLLVYIDGIGEFIERIGSTTDLDTAQWEDYIEKIRAWGSTVLDITISMPNEYIEY
jgi:hypothetical protein